jgi:hypothetical protein
MASAAIGFERGIKPYFTDCYRDHMLNKVPRPIRFDLWSRDAVMAHWDAIHDSVSDGSMPARGCPEGVWDEATKNRFLQDFQAWKDGGYQP